MSTLAMPGDAGTLSDAINKNTNPNIVVLQHPSGSKIVLVATAHISVKSVRDVEAVIEAEGPAAVVLELDPERMDRLVQSAQCGDRFGLKRYQETSSLKVVGLALTGDLLAYASGLFYVCTGALIGTRPGGEFLAAAEAAERVGAKVVLADRSQWITMRRMQWYARQLVEVERGHPSRRRIEFPTDGVSSPSFPGQTSPLDRDSTFPSNEMPSPGSLPAQAQAEVAAAVRPEDNPWGLAEDDSSENAVKARLLRMMQEGGCPQPNAVLEAAQRLLRGGLDPGGTVSPKDLLQVRACGTTLVETFRRRAMTGDDAWMKELEVESIGGAKGALGAQRSGAAMRKVILDERDWILARRLWEAGEEAGGAPVVGVVGAGHVNGIRRYWDVAGTPEAAARADEYASLPPGEGHSALGLAATAGVLGFMAYRRPKAVGLFLGAITLASAPYLGFSVFTVRRLTSFAEKLAATCEKIDASGDMPLEAWPQEGEWQ